MTPERRERLRQHWEAVKRELAGSSAQLLVVSKHQSAEEVRVLYELGQRDFGENRVQELVEKDELLGDCVNLRWHLIGHLQSNKISKLNKLPRLHAIHSVDDLELAERLARGLTGHHEGVGLFLQVNTAHEEEKSGFEDYAEVYATAKKLMDLRNVRLQGLMTMGRIRTDDVAGEAHRCFKALQEMGANLQKSLGTKPLELSMGMSGDYPIALQYGASWVRVGSKIFRD